MDPNAINEIINALIDAGIPPEKLEEALQGAEGPGPEAEGPASEGAENAEKSGSARRQLIQTDGPILKKIAADAKAFMKTGRFRRVRKPTDAKTASERKEATEYLRYVREVFAL